MVTTWKYTEFSVSLSLGILKAETTLKTKYRFPEFLNTTRIPKVHLPHYEIKELLISFQKPCKFGLNSVRLSRQRVASGHNGLESCNIVAIVSNEIRYFYTLLKTTFYCSS